MIKYEDIPKYCDRVDRRKKSPVLLSYYQAWLFKKIENQSLKKLPRILRYIDAAFYFLLILLVFVSARNLLLLIGFRLHNDPVNSIYFERVERNKILVNFNPNSSPNSFDDQR